MKYHQFFQQIPSDLCSLPDYQALAEKLLPDDIWTYIASGSSHHQTLQDNLQQFHQFKIWNRVLNPLSQGHTRTTLLGHELHHPILLGPVAYQKLVHPNGELATALAADATNSLMVTSTLASTPLEQIAENTSRKWFQLYFQPTRELTLKLVKRAEKAGYTALVVTLDVPINGLRTAIQKSGFVMPKAIKAVNIETDAAPFLPPLKSDDSPVFQGWMSLAPSWEDLKWLRQQTDLPIIAKGISHPQDAQQIKSLGIEGIIISNHGGRALDSSPTAMQVLPMIREALGKDFSILVDGGIRHGGDVFKAIARGADAILIGRPQLHGLAVAGALGVAHLMQLLIQEFEVTMALAGCSSIQDINERCLF